MPALLDLVAAYADRHVLLPSGAHVLVAVSGGPDSCVLLDALVRLRDARALTVTGAHFHHGVRGADADADAAFVRARCAELDVPFTLGRPAVPLAADEAALRRARYAWLVDAAQTQRATHVALGHTRDDQAETVLLRMLRGTGLRGLGGMRPSRPLAADGAVRLVRPMLGVTRAQVEQYAQSRQLTFRTDASNADTRYRRNAVRHDILPVLRALQPGADAHIAALADRAAADAAYLDDAATGLAATLARGHGPGWCAFDRTALAAAPSVLATRLLRAAYQRVARSSYCPDSRGIDVVLDALRAPGASGAQDWPQQVRVRWTPGRVTIAQVPDPATLAAVPVPVPGRVVWTPTGQHLTARLLTDRSLPSPVLSGIARTAWGAGAPTLVLRGWRPGDQWRPARHAGPESVAETLRAMGVPIDRRPAAAVVATGESVWWVVGARPPAEDGVSGATQVEVAVG